MQCEQIRPLLADYAAGSLPGYKVAWVAQHLAWCTECGARLASAAKQESVERETAVTAPVAWPKSCVRTSRREAKRRARRARRLAIFLILAVAAATAWLVREPIIHALTAIGWSGLLHSHM